MLPLPYGMNIRRSSRALRFRGQVKDYQIWNPRTLKSLNPKILEPHIKFMYLFLHLSRREVKLLRNTHKFPMANSPLAKLPSEEEMVGDRKLKSEIKELLNPGVCLRTKEGKKKA